MSMIETILARVFRWSTIPTALLACLMVQPGQGMGGKGGWERIVPGAQLVCETR